MHRAPRTELLDGSPGTGLEENKILGRGKEAAVCVLGEGGLFKGILTSAMLRLLS